MGFGLLSEAAWFAPKNRQRKSSPLPWQPLFLTSRHLYILRKRSCCPPTRRTLRCRVAGGYKFHVTAKLEVTDFKFRVEFMGIGDDNLKLRK